MFRRSALLTFSVRDAAIAAAQHNMPLIEEKSTCVSDHVWAIVG
jgi:hypothetical protein